MELGFSKMDWNEEPSLREKIYFGAIFFLIAFAMMRLFWFPTQDVIQKKKQEINNIALQITTLQKFIDIDKRIAPAKQADDLGDAGREIEKVLKSMPRDPRKIVSSVIRDITSRNRLGSVVLKNVAFQTAVTKGGYALVPVELSITGTFSAIQNYFSSLEKQKYLFTIDNVKFETTGQQSGLITVGITASIYVGMSRVVPEPANP